MTFSREDAYKISRDDAYKMTREDVLRELELLPIWTLRAPLINQAVVEPIQAIPVEEATLELVEPIVIEQVLIEEALIEPSAAVSSPAVFIISDDKKWAFVLPAELTGQAADLFNNILRALHINKTQTSHTQQLVKELANLEVGVIVAMGEEMAQQLFASAQTLENLRGKIQTVNGLPIMATYHPNELLQHALNKAKTWDDLCLAMDALSN